MMDVSSLLFKHIPPIETKHCKIISLMLRYLATRKHKLAILEGVIKVRSNLMAHCLAVIMTAFVVMS